MNLLAIETSCDETSIAVLNNSKSTEKRIVSLITHSQIQEHRPYAGVVPELAARAHLSNIEAILKTALAKANITLPEIHAIAATGGPGLIGGVLVGITFAKALSVAHNIPFYAINHLEGHTLTARLSNNAEYPYLLLLTSGGHCMFVEVLGYKKYQVIGQTLDDAAGECFDKVAKVLNLGFPGGPALEKCAKSGNPKRFNFPKPLEHKPTGNFSFSGLKTAVKNCAENHYLTPEIVRDIAASFQYTVGEIFKERLSVALRTTSHKVQRFVMAGGVAANTYLRTQLQQACETQKIEAIFPPQHLCTDNAAMIGWVALEGMVSGVLKPTALDFQPRPRWSLDD